VGQVMAHRVVVGKKPANKIGGLNIGEIAAVAALLAVTGGDCRRDASGTWRE